jgi:hypothetical protein
MKLLISSIEEIQVFLNVYSSFSMEELKPFIKIAQKKYVRKAIGKEMFAELLDAYQASIADNDAIAMTEDQTELWELAADAIAHLAMFEGNDSFNIAYTNGGATRMENTNLKSAYQYQVLAYKASRKDQGFAALDSLMEYLDENEDTFETYKTSDARTAYKSQWIQDVETFDSIRNISGSRWIFLQVRNNMDHVVNTQIKAIIGSERFETIKSELLTSLSEENETLMRECIRPAIAHLAFADAIIDLAMKVSDKGVTIYNTEGARGEIELYKEAPDNYMFRLKQKEERKGKTFLLDLEQRIKALASEEIELTDGTAQLLDENQAGFGLMT